MTYNVTITVPSAPRLGSTTITLEAASTMQAEVEALRRFRKAWAVGAPVAAKAVQA